MPAATDPMRSVVHLVLYVSMVSTCSTFYFYLQTGGLSFKINHGGLNPLISGSSANSKHNCTFIIYVFLIWYC